MRGIPDYECSRIATGVSKQNWTLITSRESKIRSKNLGIQGCWLVANAPDVDDEDPPSCLSVPGAKSWDWAAALTTSGLAQPATKQLHQRINGPKLQKSSSLAIQASTPSFPIRDPLGIRDFINLTDLRSTPPLATMNGDNYSSRGTRL